MSQGLSYALAALPIEQEKAPAETAPRLGARCKADNVIPLCDSARYPHATRRPAASSLTASVVIGLPPMPQSPLLTSVSFTHVEPRKFSPSIETMASVNF